jgi:hypothetical protein
LTYDLTIIEREGYTRFYTKGLSDGFNLSASCYDDLMEAWKAGRAFFDGWDCYGDPITVKLGDVSAIALCTPEGMERWKEDDRIVKQRELLMGDA